MNRSVVAILKRIFTTILIASAFLPAYGQEPAEKQEVAKEILVHFRNGALEDIVAHFDGTMKEHLTTGQLASLWKGIQQQYGSFENVEKTWSESRDGYIIVVQQCNFKNKPLLFNLTFDNESKIAGMYFRPVP